MENPAQKRMKFATKDALVLTFHNGESGAENNRQQPRLAFYVDDEAEKLAFIEWFVDHAQSDQFRSTTAFDAHVVRHPDAKFVLLFEAHYSHREKDERIFPIGSDADKLALFELIVTGELDKQMGVTLGLMQEMSASLNTTESFLGYLSVLPGMVDHMDNMKTNIAISTDAMGCSAIFGGGSKPECQA